MYTRYIRLEQTVSTAASPVAGIRQHSRIGESWLEVGADGVVEKLHADSLARLDVHDAASAGVVRSSSDSLKRDRDLHPHHESLEQSRK